MNRHGEGRPSAARWYQSIARSRHTSGPTASRSWRDRRSDVATRRACVMSVLDLAREPAPGCRWPAPPSADARTSPERQVSPPVVQCGAQTTPSPIAGHGVAHASGRWRSRRGVDGAWDPATWCTTPTTSAHAFRSRGCGGTASLLADAADHTVSLWRPFRRRALSTARPGTRRHPGAEAVLAGTAAVVGLVGALHAILLIGPHRPSLSGASLIAAVRRDSTFGRDIAIRARRECRSRIIRRSRGRQRAWLPVDNASEARMVGWHP